MSLIHATRATLNYFLFILATNVAKIITFDFLKTRQRSNLIYFSSGKRCSRAFVNIRVFRCQQNRGRVAFGNKKWLANPG
jgi:hypothetical protein